ncbi:hypothetical protein CTAYLR_000469 [Chrysophaeum taylorii]|uniref:RBR-type E3 ubiquitin transferase n=1 Tax=Chrysophaeum taylorii TaxID=2483200 RepID=A0AAD7UI78_9STRA|nr:hypothetical protein CTAYLR_000469 [Chrysophaeum taylorii]
MSEEEEDENYVYSDEDELELEEEEEEVYAPPSHGRASEEGASSRGSTESAAMGGKRLQDGTYTLIERSEVEAAMLAKAREVSELLEVSASCAEVLLRYTGWSSERLMEQFLADPEKVSSRCGVDKWTGGCEGSTASSLDSDVALPPAPSGGLTCRICFLEVPASEALTAPCGHSFCGECYEGYLANKIDEGSSCVHATCPEDKCTTLVPPKLWQRALSGIPDKLAKYKTFRIDNFITFSKELRWCPAPNCGKVVRAGACVASVKCAPGGCGFSFCMKCGEEAHQPASCELVQQWAEKCQNESETANWILANTKRCPKCQTRIEKNQGCNHMSCSQCKHEFCWMCMGDWSEHGASTGGYYKCNKFDPLKATDEESDSARAKRELDRYLHYYKRYHGHDQAQKFAVKQLEATEKRMVELQESTHGSWIDVQFLKTANEMVIDCRRALKSTYIFGYYLDPSATKQRELFENLQEHLERFTETLSEMTEQPLETMDRTEVVNITRVTESFLHNLISGAESGLDVVPDAKDPTTKPTVAAS